MKLLLVRFAPDKKLNYLANNDRATVWVILIVFKAVSYGENEESPSGFSLIMALAFSLIVGTVLVVWARFPCSLLAVRRLRGFCDANAVSLAMLRQSPDCLDQQKHGSGPELHVHTHRGVRRPNGQPLYRVNHRHSRQLFGLRPAMGGRLRRDWKLVCPWETCASFLQGPWTAFP